MEKDISMPLKPSERIKEIHRALKVLDGQNPEEKNFAGRSFMEQAIIQFLDEQIEGTPIQQRGRPIIDKK